MRTSIRITLILTMLFTGQAFADLWDVPTGLTPGDTFRWVFVTSDTTNALSSDINYYNDFVNEVADLAALADPTASTITGVQGISSIADIEWQAIGSTASIDAIDNIGTSPAGIYTTLGEKVADGTNDLFDTDGLYTPIRITEYGQILVDAEVWTGSQLGMAAGSLALGGDGR